MNGLIAHIDPSICSLNLGDYIISESVSSVLGDVFPYMQKAKIPSQDIWWSGSYRVLKNSSLSFVGGTNLLTSNMPFYRQWKMSPVDIFFKNEIVLLGAGWWQYQEGVNFYSRFMYRNILSKKYFHSVRDEYTLNKLKSIGVDNVINTSCPTMWSLTQEFCESIPRNKSKDVVVTLTDYRMDIQNDSKLLACLSKWYKKVFIWPQGHLDYKYINGILGGLGVDNVEVIRADLKCYDDLLENNPSIDYVGTRLHAGVRALQKGIRSIIIEVDNRASEKAKSFDIVTVSRNDFDRLEVLINEGFCTKIRIPLSEINRWKEQFE